MSEIPDDAVRAKRRRVIDLAAEEGLTVEQIITIAPLAGARTFTIAGLKHRFVSADDAEKIVAYLANPPAADPKVRANLPRGPRIPPATRTRRAAR